jgi:hypothetical protein
MFRTMNSQQTEDREVSATDAEGWGYRVFPRPEGGDLGYARLLVAIRKQPTQDHFDPERLRFRLRGPGGEVMWRTASWRVPVEQSGRICPGPVVLLDRYDKEVEFFTLGGSVRRVPDSSALIYLFESNAPILELTPREKTVSDQLAYEAEEVLGRIEEQWDEHRDGGFAERLTEIDPFALYVSILDAILLRYGRAESLHNAHRTLHTALEEEKQRLRAHELWPDQLPTPEDLVFGAA